MRDVMPELRSTGDGGAAIPTAHSRSRLGKAGWVVAGLATVVALALAFIHFREAPEPRPMTRFSVDRGPDAASAPRITAAISPNGRRLTFIARAADGKERSPRGFSTRPTQPWSPGPKARPIRSFRPTANARGASWGEDGSIIATLNSTSGAGLSRVPDSGGAPQSLTKPADTGDASHRWPQILPGGQAVLFSGSLINGEWDNAAIDVLSLKTGKVKVVERGGYFARYVPTSSRSGTLVYIHQGTLFGVPFDPERLEVRGTPAPLLEEVAGDPVTAGRQFDFSRNGTFVYLSGKSVGGSTPLVWLDSTGKTEPLLATPGVYYAPRLSPDGKPLAFSEGAKDIAVYDWERDRTTRLTFTSQAIYVSPVWTPDGKYIVFRSQSAAGFSFQWVRADGAGGAQRLMESKSDLRPYSFSPDGKRLAFGQASPQAGFNIWTLPLDISVADPEHPKAGKPELFLSTPAEEYEPAFSPDGRWIAYHTTASGPAEVYVQPSPGTPGGAGGKWRGEITGPVAKTLRVTIRAVGANMTSGMPVL